eukprot:399256-Rhodomonas_salina.3
MRETKTGWERRNSTRADAWEEATSTEVGLRRVLVDGVDGEVLVQLEGSWHNSVRDTTKEEEKKKKKKEEEKHPTRITQLRYVEATSVWDMGRMAFSCSRPKDLM